MIPSRVTLVDVGPRDGLQNEPQPVAASIKIELIDRLTDAGLPVVEATAFVSPKWVPQMADNAEVLAGIERKPGVRTSVLIPNMKGLDAALSAPRTLMPCRFAAATTGAKRSMLSAIEQLMFFWLNASVAAAKTTISSGQCGRGAESAASSPFMFGISTE